MNVILDTKKAQNRFSWISEPVPFDQHKIIEFINGLDPEYIPRVQLSQSEYWLIKEYL
ncbi:hypothetical protein Asfd1_129 [Aeromonas phage Asfd_1]|nr:hypothetical protein Asfd1_129 [Aeromonas phage Asfd_1]